MRAHTSAFWGSRIEFYVIAEDQKTKLLSWIIVDYITDTISYDSKNGLASPNSNQAVMTIDYSGTIFIDIQKKDNSHKLKLEANIEKGEMRNLDQRLWLEGNLSIGYGRHLSDNGADIFALKFEPGEVEKALKVPASSLRLESNTWYDGLFAKDALQIVCFPYAQHFVSDSPGHSSFIKSKEELALAVKAIDFDKIKVFSTKSFKIMFLIGALVSFFITLSLVLVLIFTNLN